MENFIKQNMAYKISTIKNLKELTNHIELIMPIIDSMPNLTFFIKDINAQYILVNNNLIHRLKLDKKSDAIGRTSNELFKNELGFNYTKQDMDIIRYNRKLNNRLELHYYKNGDIGWCTTTKVPILDNHQKIIGIAGVSIDLQDEKLINNEMNSQLNNVITYINKNFQHPISINNLTTITNLSTSQLNRNFKEIFSITPTQLIQKKRLEYAIYLLTQNFSITEIAGLCGYTDHSAFSRKFKESTSLTPSEFKKTHSTNHKFN